MAGGSLGPSGGALVDAGAGGEPQMGGSADPGGEPWMGVSVDPGGDFMAVGGT